MIGTAWAVVHMGRIEIASISPRRIGAIVNWLVAGPPRVMVLNDETDEAIERKFERYKGPTTDIIQVEVSPKRG